MSVRTCDTCQHAEVLMPAEPCGSCMALACSKRDRPNWEARAEPTPTGTEALVCADIARRQLMGVQKYGTTVAANPLALRQWLQHAYEEALDLAVYLRRSMDELDRR